MRRRDFIKRVVCSAIVWPFAARAQQAAMPVIGYLHSGSPSPYAHLVADFHQGLSETGYLQGQNVRIEYRWAEGRYDELPALAADLVSLGVAVLVAQGGDPPPMAAKSATATIPIVFTCSSDPIKLGLVRSLNQPGGNVTGFWAGHNEKFGSPKHRGNCNWRGHSRARRRHGGQSTAADCCRRAVQLVRILCGRQLRRSVDKRQPEHSRQRFAMTKAR
jgi:ABC transporter substrate binding protein